MAVELHSRSVAAPRITPHPLGGLFVTFGTGKLFEVSDPTDMQVQSLYALRDVGQVPTDLTILPSDLKQIRLEQFDLDGDSNALTPDDVFRRLNAADVAAFRAGAAEWLLYSAEEPTHWQPMGNASSPAQFWIRGHLP